MEASANQLKFYWIAKEVKIVYTDKEKIISNYGVVIGEDIFTITIKRERDNRIISIGKQHITKIVEVKNRDNHE